MSPKSPEQAHILFLFSDTGGGHRSGAEAIIEGLELEFPGRFSTEMVDVFKEYAPPPLNRTPQIYPTLARMPDMWRLGYQALDDPQRSKAFIKMMYPYVRRGLHRLLKNHPCDLIVSVHQFTNQPVLDALHRHPGVLFATVVLDMVSAPAPWFDPRANLVVVATPPAQARALELGVPPGRVRVTGMPVAERFCSPAGERNTLREQLGWPQDLPVVLLVGGGEGMGPLKKLALAIDEKNPCAMLAVVCGRNQKLRAELEQHPWQMPARVYGFVREMPEFMQAADILVTKAGPGTIAEAFIAGLPLVLYSRMPGQEDGNVVYVVKGQAGVWAPKPRKAAWVVVNWLENPDQRQKFAENSRRLGFPQAARQIARLLAEQIDQHRGGE